MSPIVKRNDLVSGKNYLFIIGINQYEHLPPLSNAVKDVEDLKTVLMDRYKFEPENVFTLLDEQATRENIYDTFETLRKTIIEEQDNALIYFSGHGFYDDETEVGYWIPVEARVGKESDYIENSSILSSFIRPLKTKHTFLVSDSCFSGSLFVDGISRSAFDSSSELEKHASRWALCSGRKNEEVYDGNPGENSPFAKSFLSFLTENSKRFLSSLAIG